MTNTPTTRTGTRLTRRGRRSIPLQVYHVVTSTAGREPAFRDFGAARLLVRTLRRQHDAGKAITLAFAIMPDHLHWLVQLTLDSNLPTVLDVAKAETARAINRHLGRRGRFWQRGYYDRAIRRDVDLVEVARYVVGNPLRDGLVERLADYPHWDSCWL